MKSKMIDVYSKLSSVGIKVNLIRS